MFLENKYTRWYYAIITNAQSKLVTGYIEKHHIIPKSLNGSNAKDNLVKLTAREHFICHVLLVRMTTGKDRYKMAFALSAMAMTKSRPNRYFNSHLYEYHKTLIAESISLNNSGRIGYWNGKTFSLEHKKKLSQGKKGIHTKEDNPFYGKRHSEETRKKMSDAAKKRKPANLGKKFTTEHRQKLSEAKQGKYLGENSPSFGLKRNVSNETRAKLSIAVTESWNKRKLNNKKSGE